MVSVYRALDLDLHVFGLLGAALHAPHLKKYVQYSNNVIPVKPLIVHNRKALEVVPA